MSDGKRRRYRKPKDDKPTLQTRPVILAKREETAAGSSSRLGQNELEVSLQPKILLKTKTVSGGDCSDGLSTDGPLKTIIVNRSDAASSSSPAPSPNITKEQGQQQQMPAQSSNDSGGQTTQIVEPVPQMTRPTTVISSTG